MNTSASFATREEENDGEKIVSCLSVLHQRKMQLKHTIGLEPIVHL